MVDDKRFFRKPCRSSYSRHTFSTFF